ncbi:helix-turn-helix transcriptional regulator [Ascidiimonas aurantiaca]|uniref:helix-turn-helix domain-containing protein n=1 Tax=Ascidiimonas aurantiaca TaxID=1685432 RepID=UPI0030EDBC4D
MVNDTKFPKRLEKIIGYYELSASAFADKVGVQRSSISHIISGRNKPSLDFIMKIIEAFPEVDLYWLLMGKGTFPTVEKKIAPPAPPDLTSAGSDLFTQIRSPEPSASITPEKSVLKKTTEENIHKEHSSEIERVIVFYKDGTFRNYQN